VVGWLQGGHLLLSIKIIILKSSADFFRFNHILLAQKHAYFAAPLHTVN